MEKHILKYGSDDYFNEGIMLEAIVPFFGFAVSQSGFFIAHDLIEHVNGLSHMGTTWDELEALGAILFSRAQHDSRLHTNESIESILASDMVRMFDQYLTEVNTHPVEYSYKDDISLEFDASIRKIEKLARKIAKVEIFDFNELKDEFNEFIKFSIAHMRIGINKANNKYQNSFDMFNIFISVETAVENLLNEYPIDEYRHCRFEISIDKNKVSYKKIDDEI